MGDHDQPNDRLGYSAMFGQESGADVEFEVGREGEHTWRLTAHRRVLAASSPVMKAWLYGPLAKRGAAAHPIRVGDVDGRAFECLLRYLYGLPPQLQSVPTAMATLYASHKYLCPGLELECAAFLSKEVQQKPDYVLDVLQAANLFCQVQEKSEWEPTAPPAEDIESDSEGSRLVHSSIEPVCNAPRRGSCNLPGVNSGECLPLGEACRRLRHNCLQVIDQHADLVLALEQVEDLDLDTLLAVTCRDTLAVSNELLVLRAAERWAECECKRLKLQHSSHHLRQAFGDPHVVCGGGLARLLLLTAQQFAEGPARSPLLTAEEQRSILVHLVGSSRPNMPSSPVHVAWKLLANPRTPRLPEYLPIPSSQGCVSRHSPEGATTRTKRRGWGLRWPRSKRKSSRQQQKKAEKRAPEGPSCCSKICESFLTVLACLLD